jgi:putative peptide zinc metalloprotease protein
MPVDTWPVLREDLDLLPGPKKADGQPTWTLHDPARNRFFSIDWPSFEILKRWSYGDAKAIAESASTETTLAVTADDVMQFSKFLIDNQLTEPELIKGSKSFATRLQKMQGSWLKRLVHHYLFFRVPLWNPDSWLEHNLKHAGFFFTRTFLFATMIAFVVGLFQISKQWDVFVASFVDTLTWSGLVSYGIGLVAIKFIHELGHAFTAKRMGCRIPAIGIAFLVMFPMAYTDTNETWRVTSHRKRLLVASAGIMTELAIAVWATLAWVFLPDGALRSVAFFLGTTSWIATVIINASPFLRFDGYFILSDAIDMPNLHERSFALARWKLREWLFALGEPRPEHFSATKQRSLILFAWLTWLYRLIVFLGIAVLVYEFFFKALGVVLFVIELLWFVAIPVWRELQQWQKRWPKIRETSRTRRLALGLLVLVVVLFLPWPTRIHSSGVFKPHQAWEVTAAQPAVLISQAPVDGTVFEVGDILLTLDSPELQAREAGAIARLASLRWQASTAGLSDSESRARMQSLREQMATVQAELDKVLTEKNFLSPRAPFRGVIRDVDPELAAGQWLSQHERLAVLVQPDPSVVETYLDEEAIKRISIGDTAIFLADGRDWHALSLEVVHIDADVSRELPDGILAAQNGGHIIARPQKGKLVPEQAIYRVRLAPVDGQSINVARALRGDVVIRGNWQSPVWPFVRNVAAVFVREFSF